MLDTEFSQFVIHLLNSPGKKKNLKKQLLTSPWFFDFIIVVIFLLRGRIFFLFSTFSKWNERGSPFKKVAHPDEDESKGHTLKTVKIVGKHHAHLRDGTRLIYLTVYFISFRFVDRFPFWPLWDMEQIKTNSFACSVFKKKKFSIVQLLFFFIQV